MDLSPSTLFVGLLVSGVGFVLFSYGKKQRRGPQLAAGIMLMAIPLLPGGPLVALAAGCGVVGAMWLAIRRGM